MKKLVWSYLKNSQKQMIYGKKAIDREFKEGDEVLILLPLNGQPFKAKVQGSYTIAKKINQLKYLVNMPKQRYKMQVFHINRLKKYFR